MDRGIYGSIYIPDNMPMTRSLSIFIVAMASAFANPASVATKNELATTSRGLESLEGKHASIIPCVYCHPTGNKILVVRIKRG